MTSAATKTASNKDEDSRESEADYVRRERDSDGDGAMSGPSIDGMAGVLGGIVMCGVKITPRLDDLPSVSQRGACDLLVAGSLSSCGTNSLMLLACLHSGYLSVVLYHSPRST